MSQPPPKPARMSQLQDIRNQQNAVTDESLQSTRRIVALLDTTEAIGTKTLEELDGQGRQLNNIEKGLGTINNDIKRANGILGKMKTSCFWYICCECCGNCVLPCYRRSTSMEGDNGNLENYSKNVNNRKVVGRQPKGSDTRTELLSGGSSANGRYVERITGDAREDEMDDNFDQASKLLANIRNIAIDQGNEITRQNEQIDRINNSAGVNVIVVEEANKRAQKLL